MKKYILTLLAIIYAAAAYCLNYDFSAVCPSGQRLYYKIVENGVAVSCTNPTTQYPYSGGTAPTGDVIIPDSVQSGDNWYKVVGINKLAFGRCTLSSISLPNTLEYIDESAFYYCQIGTISIPSSVTRIKGSAFAYCKMFSLTISDGESITIGDYAFSNCENLSYCYIGSGVVNIPNNCFYACHNITRVVFNAKNYTSLGPIFPNTITSLTIGDSVQSIPQNAFSNCANITGVLTIPNSVTHIGDGAFQNCTGISELRLSNNLTHIGNDAFSGCTGLTGELVLPNSLITIGDSAFWKCNGIDTLIMSPLNSIEYIGNRAFGQCRNMKGHLYLSESLTSIGQYAFHGCSNLTGTLTLPQSLTSIGQYAFCGCSHLTGTLTLPQSLTSIGQSAFSSCSGFTRLIISDGADFSLSGNVFNSCSNLRYCYLGNKVRESVSPDPNFSNCTSLDTIVYNARNYERSSDVRESIFPTTISTLIFGDSVRVIPYYAFDNCSGLLGTLTLPNSLTSIGKYAFYACNNLTGALPNSLTSIGKYAFYACNNLTGELLLPHSLHLIGEGAFFGCRGITRLIISDSANVSLPSTVFTSCTNLRYCYIGKNVRQITEYSFGNCNSLDTVEYNAINCSWDQTTAIFPTTISTLVIGNDVQKIPSYAFKDCDNILQVDMHNAPATIGQSCFEHCDRLVTVNLSPNTDSIQQNAFKDCMRLTNVNIEDGTVSIGENAFQNCPRLINVHFGDGVQSIGSNAFKDDGRLLYSGLPSALQTIGENAFQNCTEFGGDITIPSGVTEIKDFAFSGCSGITSLIMRPNNPPTLYAHTFDSVDVNIPVYVPCGRVLYYFVTNYWENFPNLLEAEPYEVTVTSNDEMMGTAEIAQAPTCDNPRTRITATAEQGYHFIQWSDGNLANPRIVDLTSDSTFEAQFAINYISILVHSSDSIKGNVTGSGRYYYDSPVSLTATPNNNYHFLCWSDGNTSNPRYMAATHDSTFTAVFVSNVSTITIGNNNPDMGNVSGGGVYYYQNWVTFSASPYYGYHFTQWSDGNVENPRTIMVDRDTTFTATFALNLYAVSVNSVNSTMGYVEGTGNYTYQTTIGITGTPNYGYHFTQWNDGNTNNPRTIVVSKDTMFTAQFAANEYQLTVSSNYPAMGSAYGAGTFNYSTQTTIAAAANYGYHFTQWSDGNTENPRLVTVTHNTDFEAQFAPNLYAITTNASNPVCGSASGGGSYNYLSSISIVATPNYGYHFTQWSDGNTDNPRIITVMSNGTYTAQFAINSYAITALPNNSSRGLVSGSGNYVYNSATTISATSYYGYHFTQWNDGNTENPRTVVITQDAQYTAQFDYNTYQLNTFSNDITIGNVTGGGSYDFNSQVAITAIAAPHYHFVHWNDTVADNPRTIVLTRDTNITAIFSIDRHSVDVRTANLQMGSTLGSGEYDYNASVFITAVPNYGYHFESWADGSTQNPRRIVVQNDSIFTAVFGINQYAIITHSNDTLMGSVTPSASYNYNTMATIMAMPAAGHHFVAWNDGNTDNPRTFVVTCDSTFTAQFAIKTYMLTVHPNDTAMGSVSGGGIYQYREQAVLSATAREHYHFVQWHDGNTSNPRILLVSNDSNFVAQFVEDERYEISVISTDVNAGTTTGSGSYYVGTQLYISANPDEHHLFTRWTDGSVDNPRSITVLGDATYIACFDPKEYEISVFPNNEAMGSVSGGGTFSYGSTTTINAYPRAGYHFERWSDGDINASRTITVEENTVYIAEFAEGTGIEEHSVYGGIHIYPNPTKGSVTIIHKVAVADIFVYDAYGRLILSQKTELEQTKIDMSDFANGLYLLRIIFDGKPIETVKVVKE